MIKGKNNIIPTFGYFLFRYVNYTTFIHCCVIFILLKAITFVPNLKHQT